MSASIIFNGTEFTEVDASAMMQTARDYVFGCLSGVDYNFDDSLADFDFLDEIVYEYPSLTPELVKNMAYVWGDIVGRRLGFKWYRAFFDEKSTYVLANFDVIAYVVFPCERVREGLMRGGASFECIYAGLMFEMAISSGSIVLQTKAVDALRKNSKAMDFLKKEELNRKSSSQ